MNQLHREFNTAVRALMRGIRAEYTEHTRNGYYSMSYGAEFWFRIRMVYYVQVINSKE